MKISINDKERTLTVNKWIELLTTKIRDIAIAYNHLEDRVTQLEAKPKPIVQKSKGKNSEK